MHEFGHVYICIFIPRKRIYAWVWTCLHLYFHPLKKNMFTSLCMFTFVFSSPEKEYMHEFVLFHILILISKKRIYVWVWTCLHLYFHPLKKNIRMSSFSFIFLFKSLRKECVREFRLINICIFIFGKRI